MNENISALEPKAVWTRFAEICKTPRPSHNEGAIREYLVKFATDHAIEHVVDGAGNIIFRKPATVGFEDRKIITLQAHVDMVPQKNSDKNFDFNTDAIQAYIDGDWVTANGTTLGADNGMGIAAILAIFESKTLKHGVLEALFTASEEAGMDGAFAMKSGLLQGEILLNLDSETEGELYVGCAGGLDANIKLKYKQDEAPSASTHTAMRIELKGLKGGHSGFEIILSRANANKIMNRFLKFADKKQAIRLSQIDGGGLRNAIPREAVATVVIPTAKTAEFIADAKAFEQTVIAEFKGIESGISFKVADCQMPKTVIDIDSQRRLFNAVYACANGVIKMSQSMVGLVQTSTNLARVVSEDGQIKIQCLLRSSSRSEKEELGESISSAFELAGADVELTGAYDGWNPNMDSPILKTMVASYKDLFGIEPAITATHAGLECGIIGGSYPGMDMISFGPTICSPHSPNEKVNIESVDRFWQFLNHTIANAPKK